MLNQSKRSTKTNQNNPGWKAGFAEGDITPPLGRPMAGYGMERYAKGIIAPLRAQALALEDANGSRGLILTADIIGFDSVLRDLLRARIGETHGLEAPGILLCPSHTHWGPGLLYRINFYAGLPDVFTRQRLTAKLIELADEAFQSLTAAKIDFTELNTAIGHNRRVPNEDGSIGWGAYPEGHYDTHTPILRIQRRPRSGRQRKQHEARPASTILLAGHACHPTSTGATMRWSPDYPGAMRDTLEQHFGSDCRAMFVMGCGANAKVTHIDNATGKPVFSGEPRRAKQAGQKLGRAIIKHLESTSFIALEPSLDFRQASAPLPFARRLGKPQLQELAFEDNKQGGPGLWAQQSLAFPDARKAYDYEVVAWIIGNQLTAFALPDEVCSPVGPRTRSQAKTPYAMTIGYANSAQCYIPTNTIVREGGYEGFSSHRAYFMPAPFSSRIDQAYTALIETLLV